MHSASAEPKFRYSPDFPRTTQNPQNATMRLHATGNIPSPVSLLSIRKFGYNLPELRRVDRAYEIYPCPHCKLLTCFESDTSPYIVVASWPFQTFRFDTGLMRECIGHVWYGWTHSLQYLQGGANASQEVCQRAESLRGG